MPAQSTLSNEEKTKVKAAVNSPANKIFTAALARIYYAYPKPDEWSYTGLQGALAFVRDTQGVLNLKLVDLVGTRGIIWEHELYEGFEYFQDRPYFHSFAGDDCMIGIVFADESEAKTFHKKVTSKKVDGGKSKSTTPKKKAAKPSKGGKIDKSMISGPTEGSFKHVAHMGYDPDSGFTSTNVDPSWEAFLGNLEGQGVSREVLEQNMDFIKDFVRDAQKAEAKSASAAGSGMKKKPPPPPVRPRAPPPPPPPPPPPGGASAPAELPAPQPERGALLASIQGAGVHMLKHRSESPGPARSSPQPAEKSASAGGGGDLTQALVAALTDRNRRMGDSDEEDEDEDEWD
ncbi:hypothetical protein C8Q77DRAFT_1053887 [Trametes polyzona]|nr:hypothetical protein C8Q77DRAFT_1053887 [Trametes polyzona]